MNVRFQHPRGEECVIDQVFLHIWIVLLEKKEKETYGYIIRPRSDTYSFAMGASKNRKLLSAPIGLFYEGTISY